MDRTTPSGPRYGFALAVTVCAATGIAGLVGVALPVLPELLGVDVLAGRFLAGAVAPFVHALLPLGFVYAARKRGARVPSSPWAVALVSLTAAVLGRYVGVGVGHLVLGRGLPSPLVLASSADLAAREFGAVMWAAAVLGVLGAGLWGVVGAFGGLGLFSLTSAPDEST
ncbi:hypothetical protein [Haloplanus sp. C73]|uniref:hypothetical protein n=1 Tax=Haloplanus sp. C73 TaxID=3421641 RepID=UPI003EBDB19A